jgi:triosephosphate isomerase (TIM)
MTKTIIAGNWKMNLTPEQGAALINDVHLQLDANATNDVLFCVPFTHLYAARQAIKKCNRNNFYLGAQNCYYQTSGAYTGEISIEMLKTFKVTHVLVGHSERRQLFDENNELLKQKVEALISHNITPIFCCGEPLAVREANDHESYVKQQLVESILHLNETSIKNIVIAYEPIWAIGTGVTASATQAQEMHAYIRAILAATYTTQVADTISILYGGSCNPTNANELLALKDINGGLIGGAALKPEQFVAIIHAGI